MWGQRWKKNFKKNHLSLLLFTLLFYLLYLSIFSFLFFFNAGKIPLRASQVALVIKNLPFCRRCKRPGFNPWVGKIPGGGHNPSSIFAWRIQWTEEPDRLESIGSHRVGQDWRNLAQYSTRALDIALFTALFFNIFEWSTIRHTLNTVTQTQLKHVSRKNSYFYYVWCPLIIFFSVPLYFRKTVSQDTFNWFLYLLMSPWVENPFSGQFELRWGVTFKHVTDVS